MKWSILILTQGKRNEKFCRLLDSLMPQLEDGIEVLALWNNGERQVSEYRQELIEAARGEYISFIDDDDVIPTYYVKRILPLLDGVDYIGWKMQLLVSGVPQKPTYHSLQYTNWFDDKRGYYRDLSHLNPIRRELAMMVDYRKMPWPEDMHWARALRELGVVTTEHIIQDVMYFYMFDPKDSVQTIRNARRGRRPHPSRRLPRRRPNTLEDKTVPPPKPVRPEVTYPGFRWIECQSS